MLYSRRSIEFPAVFNEALWRRTRDYNIERLETIRKPLGIGDLYVRLSTHEPSGVVSGEVELPPDTAPVSTLISKGLGRLLELGCYYDDMHRVMGNQLINDLVTLSMPAIDAVSVRHEGYKLTCKPDGTRLWHRSVWQRMVLHKALSQVNCVILVSSQSSQ